MEPIVLEEGSEEVLPWIKVGITTGRWPFQWWFEVSYWEADNELGGCWVHDYERDGGGFGLWFVIRKAQEALHDLWVEFPNPTPPVGE